MTCNNCGCEPELSRKAIDSRPQSEGNPYTAYTPESRVWEIARQHGRAAAALEGYQDAPGLDGDYTENDLLRDADWVPHDGTDLREDLIAQYRNDAAAAFHDEAERRIRLADSLNDRMEFDHVITVAADGTVADAKGVYAPELLMGTDGDGSILAEHEADYVGRSELQGWRLLSGWTGQYGYRGIGMHTSEFVGGGLAEHIIANPGTYVVIDIQTDDDAPPDGWAIAYCEPPQCTCTVPPGGPEDSMITSGDCPVHGQQLRNAIKGE